MSLAFDILNTLIHTVDTRMHTDINTGLMPLYFLFVPLQDDHKLTLDELNRKYGTDLSNVSETKRKMCCTVCVCVFFKMCYA